MKGYKFLVPVLLVALFAASVYSLIARKAKTAEQFKMYLEKARECSEQGIATDAKEAYESALKLKPSLELYEEMGEFYIQYGSNDTVDEWLETIIDKYPQKAESYQFAADYYLSMDNISKLYQLHDEAASRGVKSEKLESLIQEYKYAYYLQGEYDDVSCFSNGYCAVQSSEKWGFISADGEIAVSNNFIRPGYFSEELAGVTDTTGESYFVNSSGEKKHVVLATTVLQFSGQIHDGVFAVHNGSLWDFYNMEDKKVFGGFDDTTGFSNGIAACKKDGNWYFYNSSGKKLFEEGFENVISDETGTTFYNNVAFVKKSGKYILIDTSGQAVCERSFDDAYPFCGKNLAAVQIDGKWGFINSRGEMVIQPQYLQARSFSCGLAAVSINGMWGYINEDGAVVIEPIFKSAREFTSSGSALIKTEKGWQLLKLYQTFH